MKRFTGILNINTTLIQHDIQKTYACRLEILYCGYFLSFQ